MFSFKSHFSGVQMDPQSNPWQYSSLTIKKLSLKLYEEEIFEPLPSGKALHAPGLASYMEHPNGITKGQGESGPSIILKYGSGKPFSGI